MSKNPTKSAAGGLAYRPAQLAEAVGVSRRFIYREMKSGTLESRRLGRARVIRSADAEEWLDKKARG
jgi:excisionase family DNA binding protein